MHHPESKIITLNVNGLHNPIKRGKIIAKMKREKLHVIFWQETHLSSLEHEKLKNLGFQNTYYSSHKSGRKRGVAILIPNAVNFELYSEMKDKDGRFVLVKGKLEEEEVTLFNVYAPPGSTKSFYKKLLDLAVLETRGVLIFGGDLNVQLQPKLDSSNHRQKKNSNAIMVQHMLTELGLIDVWRASHPGDKQFTCYSACHSVYTRIDYFFMYKSDWHKVEECKIGVRDLSVHSGVYLTLRRAKQRTNTLWRLNT